MKKDKKYQFLFILAGILIIIGFVSGYFLFSDSSGLRNGSPQETAEKLPEGLMEGFVVDLNLNERYIKVEVGKPAEISGEILELNLTEETDFEELILEVYGMNDVESVGKENISGEQIKSGDEVLVSLGRDILLAVEENRELTARAVTLITAKEVD